MSTSNKLSIVAVAALFIGGVDSQLSSQGCYNTLDDAQDCLRVCISEDPVEAWGGFHNFETNGASRLWQCLDDQKTQVFDADPLVDLTMCCNMTSTCVDTMMDARSCATDPNGFIPSCIKSTSDNYLRCIQEEARSNVCRFSGLCVGMLLGNNTDGNPAFDFGDMLRLAANEVTATDCTPLEGFVDGICDVSKSCCRQCNTEMGLMANCLVNDFVLPLSVSGGTVQCSVSIPANGNAPCTLGGPVAVARSANLEDEDEAQMSEETLEGVDTTECQEHLALDFIVHNETFAVDQFMACIGKKMGEIYAKEEPSDAGVTKDDGSSATSVFGTFSLVVTMASVLVAAVAF
mmetsp:Transcript_21115/g.39438  ORF Transcript_21115/g.39438 Transcript_21115/m.39438 type:complete len:347 (-) Transcript_21115:1700-2740(-)